MKSTTPTLESLLAIIEIQAETIKQLQTKRAELEKRLNKNSRNKPPSSDGLSVLFRLLENRVGMFLTQSKMCFQTQSPSLFNLNEINPFLNHPHLKKLLIILLCQ